jgi:ADP-dependent NAD(P)H-hydrate dehydratase / NAD(P)H-hydrate epimerase
MKKISVVSSERMRRADRLSGGKFGIPVLLLMENAGRAVAEGAEPLLKRRGLTIVFCGGGNNGGDGIAAARTLQNRGYQVEVWLLKNPADYKGSLALHYQMARRLGVRFKRFETLKTHVRRQKLSRAALIVDALLGTGSHGAVSGAYAEAITLANSAKRPTLAVDIPSGLDADTGKPLGGPCIRATYTLTMAAAKPGLLKASAQPFVGMLSVAEIGIPRTLL